MKHQILFIQGGGAGAHKADGSLAGYLQESLGSSYDVRYPVMPNPVMPNEDDPDYQLWEARIRKELTSLVGDVILVGHSLGGSFLLKYLSECKAEKAIAGVFLIAAPYWGGNGWRYEGYERVALREDFASRLPRGAAIFLYHSRDDDRSVCPSQRACWRLYAPCGQPFDVRRESAVYARSAATVLN